MHYGLQFAFSQMTVYMRGHIIDEGLKESIRLVEEAERKNREKMQRLEKAAAQALSNHSSGTAIDVNVLRVAPLPNRYGSDHEPYYVKLTRPKKRR